ncbi:MAG: manganese efflux pump [Eubacterium sp.]|nr:manganese efflux pump [Eubacterium sp.]
MFFFNSALLGAGLAMDAFSVSLANGLHEPNMKKYRMSLIAAVYALFQFAMPMIGWVFVHTIVEIFSFFEKLTPIIALILLLYIGGKMLYEGIMERNSREEDSEPKLLTGKELIIQGIATSIDALSVGFTIAGYSLIMALAASSIILAVTFIICFIGLVIGKKAGTRLSWKASILGGCILIGIGIEIFVKGFFF